jgi:hypothetical protein
MVRTRFFLIGSITHGYNHDKTNTHDIGSNANGYIHNGRDANNYDDDDGHADPDPAARAPHLLLTTGRRLRYMLAEKYGGGIFYLRALQ